MLRIVAEIEVDLLGLAAVEKLRDYRFSFCTLIRAGDGEMGDCPVLRIHPEYKIQTANFALRLSSRRSFSKRGV